MKKNELYLNKYVDFYRIMGGSKLDGESNKWDRLYVIFNHKSWYYEDCKSHNAFVRIRREHFKKMGIPKLVEIDFYDYLDFKKKNT